MEYLTQNLRQFLRPQDRVLFCFMQQNSEISALLRRAVLNLGAVPVELEGDFRWINILKCAFRSRASAVFGPPLVILGLTKLARVTNTPLYFRHVLTAGYPCLDWMIDGIRRGLDCHSWGCFDPCGRTLVVGFSCGVSRGVHIREELYKIEVVDDNGILPDGISGTVTLKHRDNPIVRYSLPVRGCIERTPCACGDGTARLMSLFPPNSIDPEVLAVGQELYSWTSILDCAVRKGEGGLELELVVFPGEKLPPLPFCARKTVRVWDPEQDIPVSYLPPL